MKHEEVKGGTEGLISGETKPDMARVAYNRIFMLKMEETFFHFRQRQGFQRNRITKNFAPSLLVANDGSRNNRQERILSWLAIILLLRKVHNTLILSPLVIF